MILEDLRFKDDKQQHFFISMGIYLFLTLTYLIALFPLLCGVYYILSKMKKVRYWYQKDYLAIPITQVILLVFSSSLTLSLGVGKELYDLIDYGLFSWADLFYDILGTIFGIAISSAIFIILDLVYFFSKIYIQRRRERIKRSSTGDLEESEYSELNEEIIDDVITGDAMIENDSPIDPTRS